MSAPVVFLDTETTGLDPDTEHIFEVAMIVDEMEFVWHLEPQPEVVKRMHPKALEVNRYHERTSDPTWHWNGRIDALEEIRDLIGRRHIVGAVPDFDTRFLAAEYKRAQMSRPSWHYHLVDVEAMAIGFLAAQGKTLELPWDSNDLSVAVGVEPGAHVHEALHDARWAKAIYERIMSAGESA